jgi:hypothetical protein
MSKVLEKPGKLALTADEQAEALWHQQTLCLVG